MVVIAIEDQELLNECKKSLSISQETTELDGILNQKILIVKSFMKNAGVSDQALNNDLAVGVIVIGVSDLWSQGAGEVRFSPIFHTLLTQLTYC